jgi:hypothetical protein
MIRDYFQDALQTFNGGDWYGWKKEDSEGNVIPNNQRMTYANIEIIKEGATMPSEADVNTKIAELKQAETKQATDETSGKTKLKNLGLTDDEIKALIGK